MNTGRKHKQTGPKGVSDARLAAALRKNGGIQAAAARVLRIGRSAVCMRVAASPTLQEAMQEGMAQLIDVAQDNVVQAIHRRDMGVTRWFLERKARHLGYGTRSDERDTPRTDTVAEERRREAFNTMVTLIEKNAKAGLPPIFSPRPVGQLEPRYSRSIQAVNTKPYLTAGR